MPIVPIIITSTTVNAAPNRNGQRIPFVSILIGPNVENLKRISPESVAVVYVGTRRFGPTKCHKRIQETSALLEHITSDGKHHHAVGYLNNR